MSGKKGLVAVFVVALTLIALGDLHVRRLVPIYSRNIATARVSRSRAPIYADHQIYSYSDVQESMRTIPPIPVEKHNDYGSFSF